ncbi:MAG: hypothetical protein ABSG25_10395 [Bryobacteraceae bacterium]
MLRSLLILTIVLSCAAYAADPVGTITAGGFLKVNGHVVPTKGTPTWPLFAGDEVITEPDAAMVMIADDGSRLALGTLTRIVIKNCAGASTAMPTAMPTATPTAPVTGNVVKSYTRSVVQLHSGSVIWEASKDPKIQICALGHPVDPEPLSRGTVIIDEHSNVSVITPERGQVVVPKGSCGCFAGIPWLHASTTTIVLATGAVAALATGLALTLPSARSASAP